MTGDGAFAPCSPRIGAGLQFQKRDYIHFVCHPNDMYYMYIV